MCVLATAAHTLILEGSDVLACPADHHYSSISTPCSVLEALLAASTVSILGVE